MASFCVINALPLLRLSIEKDMRNKPTGKSEFSVYSAQGDFFSLDEIKSEGEYTGVIQWYGLLNDSNEKKCKIIGADYKNVLNVTDIVLMDENSVDELDGIIISSWFAERLKVKKNDYLHIEVNEEMYQVEIDGIAENTGFFMDRTYTVLFPINRLAEILDVGEKQVTEAYIYGCKNEVKAVDDVKVSEDLVVKKTIDEEIINSELSSYSILLVFILIFVILLVFYILYYTYKLYVIKKSVYIGTLRTCGATPAYIMWIFSVANSILVIVSGAIGGVLGAGAVSAYAHYMLGINYLYQYVEYSLISGIGSICFAVIVACFSLSHMLQKSLKFSERELLLNEIEKYEAKTTMISGIAFVITIFLTIFTLNWTSNNLVVESILLIILMAVSVMSLKFIIYIIDKLWNRRSRRGFFTIALKNVIHNVYVQKNITIITLISMLLIMIGCISFSAYQGLSSFYYNYKCNVSLETDGNLSSEEYVYINEIEGVNSFYPIIAKSMFLNERERVICYIENTPQLLSDKYLEFGIKWEMFDQKQFSKDYNCIVSEVLMRKNNWSIGDKVNLSRDGVSQEYKIVASLTSLMNNGDFIFISDYKIPFKECSNANLFLIDSERTEIILDKIEHKFPEKNFILTEIQEYLQRDKDHARSLLSIFIIFSAFVILVGIQGMYNNLKLSYLNRQKEFAIMISNGFQNNHIVKIQLLEALLCCLIGSVIAVLYVFFYHAIINRILFLMGMVWPIMYEKWVVSIPLILCVVVSLLCIGISYWQTRKIKEQLIEILKII